MEQILNIMLPLAPVGMAIMACAAFGLALSAREALGRERGLRHAAEKARDATLKTLTTYKDWDLAELDRFRRLLDCHVDALIAEATEFRDRPVPSPGRILEGLCSWNASWRRDLARCAELKPADVERLLKDELPLTPLLARRLEAFTGAPARFWEYLYRLVEYRAETEQTAVMRLGDALQLRERSAGVPASTAGSTPAAAPPSQGAAPAAGRRPRLEIVADGPPTQGPAPVLWAAPSAAAGQPASSGPSSSAHMTTTSKPPAPPPVRRSAAELPSPVVPHPGLVAREPRGALPPPPQPKLRSAVAPGSGSASSPTGIASTLTDFPIQREGARPATETDWTDIERSPLNSTLPGVGSNRTSA
ncbi:hypothetical protein WME77_34585 [Sorangium sp. So ce764]|uniref:helix-turn-helix transcriptional regulator n=1 Tax=Sorangium sp. So ce764 TaxID=3133320 RepID=UPI003F6173D6